MVAFFSLSASPMSINVKPQRPLLAAHDFQRTGPVTEHGWQEEEKVPVGAAFPPRVPPCHCK